MSEDIMPRALILGHIESRSESMKKLVNSIRQTAYTADNEIAVRRFDNARFYLEQVEKEAALLERLSAELAEELQKIEQETA